MCHFPSLFIEARLNYTKNLLLCFVRIVFINMLHGAMYSQNRYTCVLSNKLLYTHYVCIYYTQ